MVAMTVLCQLLLAIPEETFESLTFHWEKKQEIYFRHIICEENEGSNVTFIRYMLMPSSSGRKE